MAEKLLMIKGEEHAKIIPVRDAGSHVENPLVLHWEPIEDWREEPARWRGILYPDCVPLDEREAVLATIGSLRAAEVRGDPTGIRVASGLSVQYEITFAHPPSDATHGGVAGTASQTILAQQAHPPAALAEGGTSPQLRQLEKHRVL